MAGRCRTLGKLAISILSVFAIVYFRFSFQMLRFWNIFLTLMPAVEVRIVLTYQVPGDSALHCQRADRDREVSPAGAGP